MTAEKKRRQANGVGPTGRRVAENVRTLRSVSTYELARELEHQGRPIQPTGITKLEAADRRVDVDDVVALALALGVTPNRLMLPGAVGDDEIELTVHTSVSERLAWEWARGVTPLSGDEETFRTENQPDDPAAGGMTVREAMEYSDGLEPVGQAVRSALDSGVPARLVLNQARLAAVIHSAKIPPIEVVDGDDGER